MTAERLAQWLAGTDERDDEAGPEDRSMTGREVLASTAFSLTVAPEDGGASAALWGRGASSSFSGRDGPLRIDGEVTSATLGADWRSGTWLLGTMFKHSLGEGSYSGDGAGSVESALTGIYPYAALDVSARLRAWAAAGLGEGTLTLTPKNPETGEDAPALETDMSLGLAALGAKGTLVAPAGASGLRLDLETDAFWVRTASEKAPGLAAAQADVTRLRLGLDGGYVFALSGSESATGEGGATLEPTFALGLRHDGGDAETGWGVDIGGGLRWADPAFGLSAEVAGRGLIAHEAAGFRDRGVSGSLAWDSDPSSDRGPSLTLTQTLGAQAAGGADALLGRRTLADLTANDNGFESRRLELRLGYGVGAFGDRFTATPELGAALSDSRARGPPRLAARARAQRPGVVRAGARGDPPRARERRCGAGDRRHAQPRGPLLRGAPGRRRSPGPGQRLVRVERETTIMTFTAIESARAHRCTRSGPGSSSGGSSPPCAPRPHPAGRAAVRLPAGDTHRPPPPASPLRSHRLPRATGAWRAAACALAAGLRPAARRRGGAGADRGQAGLQHRAVLGFLRH